MLWAVLGIQDLRSVMSPAGHPDLDEMFVSAQG